MIVLAVDTAFEYGSIALRRDGVLLDEVLLHEPGGFGGVLFGQIGRLLERNGIRPPDIDVFAAASGPGSFTGVRIGLAAVKGVAEAHGKPCFGVSNLEAMARAGSSPSRAVLLDARRGEVYGAVFGDPAVAESVATFGQWLDTVPDEVGEFIAFDFTVFGDGLSRSRFAGRAQTRASRAIAPDVATIALERLQTGDSGDPALLDANYVRRSDAELFWKDPVR